MTLFEQIMDSLKKIVHAQKTGDWSEMQHQTVWIDPHYKHRPYQNHSGTVYAGNDVQYTLSVRMYLDAGSDKWKVAHGFTTRTFDTQAEAKNYLNKLMEQNNINASRIKYVRADLPMPKEEQ